MGVQVTEVQKALGGVSYPAGRDELVRHAEGGGAGDEVVELLRGMDEREYSGPDQVMQQLGGKLGGASDD